MTWIDTLRSLPLRRVLVQHDPETPRYMRARAKLEYVLAASVLLGSRAADYAGATELALWAPPPSGRGPGYYSCFRAFADGQVPLLRIER